MLPLVIYASQPIIQPGPAQALARRSHDHLWIADGNALNEGAGLAASPDTVREAFMARLKDALIQSMGEQAQQSTFLVGLDEAATQPDDLPVLRGIMVLVSRFDHGHDTHGQASQAVVNAWKAATGHELVAFSQMPGHGKTSNFLIQRCKRNLEWQIPGQKFVLENHFEMNEAMLEAVEVARRSIEPIILDTATPKARSAGGLPRL